MPGCKPTCVEIMYGPNSPSDPVLSRRKWNYVRNLYQPSYAIDVNGDEVDNRAIDDEARVAVFAFYDAQFLEDYTVWSTYYPTKDFEKWLQWKYELGTTFYNNLPQFKKLNHVGHCWMSCPYSTDSNSDRSISMLGSNPPIKMDHGDYYMETASNGTSWGFRCTYSGCYYLNTYGKAYFYV